MAFAVYTGTDQPTSSDEPDTLNLAFVTHLDMDLPEQDVYRAGTGIGRSLPHHQGRPQGVGSLDLTFTGLVPNGVYTM